MSFRPVTLKRRHCITLLYCALGAPSNNYFRVFTPVYADATNLRAGHLVASSGDGLDSLLLLDWRGCPPEPSTFPVLNLMAPNSMVARFKAFRFPSSPVLRFSLMMMFCDQPCKPVSIPLARLLFTDLLTTYLPAQSIRGTTTFRVLGLTARVYFTLLERIGNNYCYLIIQWFYLFSN